MKIAKYPDPILRKTAKEISDFNADLKKLTDDMAKVMYQDDGIGLAAPQVSLSKRLVVVGKGNGDYDAYVNPVITFCSKDKASNEEGCLSFPGIFGLVTRPKKIHLKYQDLEGKTHKVKLKNLDAVVLQHEVDHLDGIVFVDKAEEITRGQDILDELKKKIDE